MVAVLITLFVIVAVVLAAAIFIATRPATFRIERSAEIDAPAAKVFALINDFHEWERWSPWEKLDPAMKRTFSGPAAGPGSVYAWNGNSKAGEGQMTLLSSTPGEQVTIELKFLRPFAATNLAKFQLSRKGAKTHVIWSIDGKNDNLMSKAFSPFMDKMVGKDFEKGLANLGNAACVK
jgi:carbon monoxide dehydrogenase subunit G